MKSPVSQAIKLATAYNLIERNEKTEPFVTKEAIDKFLKDHQIKINHVCNGFTVVSQEN